MKTWNRWQCAFLSYNHCFHESLCDLNACRSNVFIFNWKIIALQSCIGFCHISTWISHRYIYVLSLLNLPPTSHPIPPLYIFTQHQIWAPVSGSKFSLAIWFYILYFICFNATFSVHHTVSFPHRLWLSPIDSISYLALKLDIFSPPVYRPHYFSFVFSFLKLPFFLPKLPPLPLDSPK